MTKEPAAPAHIRVAGAGSAEVSSSVGRLTVQRADPPEPPSFTGWRWQGFFPSLPGWYMVGDAIGKGLFGIVQMPS